MSKYLRDGDGVLRRVPEDDPRGQAPKYYRNFKSDSKIRNCLPDMNNFKQEVILLSNEGAIIFEGVYLKLDLKKFKNVKSILTPAGEENLKSVREYLKSMKAKKD